MNREHKECSGNLLVPLAPWLLFFAVRRAWRLTGRACDRKPPLIYVDQSLERWRRR